MASKEINVKADDEIKKSKMMIFAQTQPTNLPIMAQRVFLALLAQVEQTEDGDTFIIKGKDIAALSKLAPNVVGQQLKEMSEASDTLRQYTLVIHEEDGNDLRVGLISSSKYLKGERAIRISVDKYLMPYIRDMKKQYAISYKAGGPMKFRSEYSMPLYDMMNYYLSEGQHYFTVEETRKMFNIPDGRVKNTSTLNQKVINVAVRDINAYTNLEVSVEQHRKGRKILGYTFKVRDKEEYQMELITQEDERNTFLKELIGAPYYFNPKTLDRLLNEYGYTSVKNNFEYTRKKNPKNFSRYLYYTITNQIAEREMEIKQIQAIQPDYKSSIPSELIETTSLFEPQQTIDQILEEEERERINLDEYEFKSPQLVALYQKYNKDWWKKIIEKESEE